MKLPFPTRTSAGALLFCVVAWAVAPSLGYLRTVAGAVAEARCLLKKGKGSVSQLALDSSSSSRLRWIDEHEFWHAGRLFDLISIEKRGDSLFIAARCDERESAAHLFFEKLAGHGRQPTSGSFWQAWHDFPLDFPSGAPAVFSATFSSKKVRSEARRAAAGLEFPPPCPPPQASSQQCFL